MNIEYLLVPLGFTCLGLIIGVLFGRFEAAEVVTRNARNDDRKLPHVKLTLMRLGVAMLIASALNEGMSWQTFWFSALTFFCITFAHRPVFNDGIGEPIWYMGPSQRSEDDSWLDSAAWSITKTLFGRSHKDWYPFVLAVFVELALIAICITKL